MEAEATGPALPPTRFLVVVDDPDMRAVFRSLIEVEPDMEIVGEADSEGAAIDSVRRFAPDVVLLDAELAEMNGIELVRRYGVDRFPATVIVVGDERDAAAAFQVNAIDCIVKPLTDQRFRAALDRVRRHLRREDSRDLSDRLGAGGHLANTRKARNYPQHLWIRSRGQSRGSVIVVNVDDIDWVEAQTKYSCAHTRDGSHNNLRESISQIESRLDPSRFVRVHRSAIVNLDRVAKVTSRVLVLHGGTRVPIGRSHKRRMFAIANGWA